MGNARLIHMTNNMRAKADGYRFFDDHDTARNFDEVVRMTERDTLKTRAAVLVELKRRNLNDK